jgi:DNA polymerase-1
MLVTEETFESALVAISKEKYFSFDTETTGLNKYGGDSVFAVIIALKDETFYFNFNEAHPECLPMGFYSRFAELFTSSEKVVFLANAKFDMGMSTQYGVNDYACDIHDVLCADRIILNDQIRINLSTVAKKYGLEKSEAVEDYIKEHHLWNWVVIPGKKSRKKNKWFHKVPFEIMHPYGEQDARITYEIGMKQIEELKELQQTTTTDRLVNISAWEMESSITKVCYKIERTGIQINERLCREKAEYHATHYERAAREFHDLTGAKFSDHAKTLGPIFNKLGFILPKTEKGGDSISDDFLSKNNTRLSKIIQTYREHAKLANTYYRGYLYYSVSGVIHPDMKQTGTKTGRFAYADPNLQNIPDSEVRKVFIPRSGFCAVSIDFDQQEYRMMLDYANEMPVINAILKEGLDVHTATAKLVGVDRDTAKTINFLLLYGGGVAKLAEALFDTTIDLAQLKVLWKEYVGWANLSEEEHALFNLIPESARSENIEFLLKASELKKLYFKKLPGVEDWISSVAYGVKDREKKYNKGFVKTWVGRRLYFGKNFAYKAPNGIIQGGGGDVAKVAMLRLDKFLEDKKTRMVNQIHDELWFEVHETELDIVPKIKEIMEGVFPYKHLPLTCSVSYSWDNWYDLQKGLPVVKETRDQVQGESA